MTEKDNLNPLDWVIFQNKLIRYTGHDEHVIVPERVTVIGEMAFWNAEDRPIRKITLPRHLTRIEHGAFSNCSYLEEIEMPKTLESLGEAAFINCYRLKSLVIPEGVRCIGARTLGECNGMHDITLPDTLCDIRSFPTNNKNLRIHLHKGSYAEYILKNRFAREQLVFLPGELQMGFYPSETWGGQSPDVRWGESMAYFTNPSKGICKMIVGGEGIMRYILGFEHLDLLKDIYRGELPFYSGFVNNRLVFIKEGDRFKALWTIQDRFSPYEQKCGATLILYAYLNDEGEFITKFKIHQLGFKIFEGTDLEEKEYQEFLGRKGLSD